MSAWYHNGIDYFQYWNHPLVTSQELTFLIPSIQTFLMPRGIPANIYLFKFSNRDTRKKCEVCSKLTIKTPERRHGRRFGVSVVNFEHISRLMLNLSRYLFARIAWKIIYNKALSHCKRMWKIFSSFYYFCYCFAPVKHCDDELMILKYWYSPWLRAQSVSLEDYYYWISVDWCKK